MNELVPVMFITCDGKKTVQSTLFEFDEKKSDLKIAH